MELPTAWAAGTRRRVVAEDVALTVLLAGPTLWISAAFGRGSLALGVAAVLAFPLRRVAPWIAVPVVVVAAGVSSAVVPLMAVVCWLAVRGRAWVGVLAIVVAAALSLATGADLTITRVRFYSPVVLALAAVALGVWVASYRRMSERLGDALAAEEDRHRLRVEAARATERAEIAREMHDALAHRLSLISMHAGILRDTSPDLGARVELRLDLLADASRSALADLRDVLLSLRETRDELSPGRAGLAALVEEARAAGQSVDAEIDLPPALPARLDLALHRILLEGLTNARRHAGGRPVLVRVGHDGGSSVTLQIDNDLGEPASGSVGAHSDSGLGLVGIEERVTALRGSLDVVHTAGHFGLTVRLPLDQSLLPAGAAG